MVAYEHFPDAVVRYLTAGGAITTADVGKAVKISSGKVVINDSAGGDCIGVIGDVQSTLGDGDQVPIIVAGGALVQGGGVVTALANLASAADGQLVAATTTNKVLGFAVKAGTDGGFFEAFIDRAGNNALT